MMRTGRADEARRKRPFRAPAMQINGEVSGRMARFARVIALGVPHHITQRGNARRFILESDADRRVYLDLLRQSAERSEIELIGYCLISNHVRGLALKDAHGRY